ncbi:MAG: TldD/PmbA family protein [Polyangiaceae bacterium]|nr:TldD/PmbA family protein [Polyangiaceae bacterium]
MSTDLHELADHMVKLAMSQGMDLAEARASSGWELSVKVRLGETELVQEAGHRGIALRVMKQKRVATSSTSDLTESGLQRLVEDATSLVDLTEADEFAGPAEPDLLCEPPHPDLDLHDEAMAEIDADSALQRARDAEQAALDYDPRITLSEGSNFTRVSGESAIVLSGGFSGSTRGSYASLVVTPLVEDTDGKKRRGHYWTARRHLCELEDVTAVGQEAARRTLRMLGARKVETQEAPVVFDPDTARSILGTFGGCITGGAIWRRSTYLLDREGTAVASPLVNITDNPLITRAPGSRAFDGEGLRSRINPVVEAGKLSTYLLDSYSARKLGRESTASAARGGGSVSASTSNFLLMAGEQSREELLSSTKNGLYVTEMMGFGFNAITGDFSRGAAGFWIENGKLAYPVSELTISGNLNDMLLNIDAVADDLELKTSTAAPTFRVSSMTIAG